METAILRRHQHPIAIVRYTYRYLFLLLLPLARSVRFIRSPQGLYAWFRGVWIDLIILLLLVLLPYLAWQWHTYSLTEDGFTLHRGILLRRTTHIPRHSVVTLSIERPFYLRPLRAVRIAIDTDAGNGRQADFRLTVGEKSAQEILEQRHNCGSNPPYVFRPRWYHVVVLSLLVSNSLSGILLVATTLHQAGQLVGEGFRNHLLGDLETVAGYMTVIPRTAAIIALVLLWGWGVAAVRNMLRYLPFSASRYPHMLSIRTGLLTRRDYSCTAASINYVDRRQSLISKCLRLHMVFINCIGYGKEKNAMSVLIPVSSLKRSQQQVEHLLPEFRETPAMLKAAPLSAYRYIFYPLWGILLLYPASRILQHIFPQWQELICYLTTMAYIPCAWQLIVKLVDRFTAGISRSDGFYTLRYSKWFTLHTIQVPEDKVVAYDLRQTIFQRLAHNCDVLVYTYNETRQYHRIRNLSLLQAQALFDGTPPIHSIRK